MAETPREPVKVLQFLLRHFAWIAIGAVLLVAVGGFVSVWKPYQREQRFARMIVSLGGHVVSRYCGPDWIAESVQNCRPLLRIQSVDLAGSNVSAEMLSELGSLKHLEYLNLGNTQVTDAGLEHLKGLTSLKVLYVRDTQVTAEGMALLRKTLPGCKIIEPVTRR